MMRTTMGMLVLALGLSESACIALPGDVGELPGDGTSDGSGSTGDESGTTTDTSAGGSSAGGSSGDGSSGEGPEPSSPCGPDGPSCQEDQDGDCVALSEDNAPDAYNPGQEDIDADGFGDVADLCPIVAGPGDDTADSDDDGIGNGCDPCRRPAAEYDDQAVAIPDYMRVRNVPTVQDSDGDGVGDACDNCVMTPNCQGYDPMNPWLPGDPIADDDPALCQTDVDDDLIGDACAGRQAAWAAGPVGFGPDDDFDQDGLTNIVDACPRLPIPVGDAIPCTMDVDCPEGRRCEPAMGQCDHIDQDADGVGDLCDTCPAVENPLQVVDPAGDDTDGDFVGNACESAPDCQTRQTAHRTGYYPVSVGGQCCTVMYRGDDSILDPDGLPVREECPPAEDGISCRALPISTLLAPGLVSVPPGCEAALADAGLTVETHVPLTPADVGSIEELWSMSCRLPPSDQDFDGVADSCDLCPFAFDPANQSYIDDMGQMWPNDGRFCNGEYSLNNCG